MLFNEEKSSYALLTILIEKCNNSKTLFNCYHSPSNGIKNLLILSSLNAVAPLFILHISYHSE